MMSESENGHFEIRFPKDSGGLDQHQEWFEVMLNGRARRLRVHDYAALYETPGLYEALVYRTLQCQSPASLVNLLSSVLAGGTTAPADLRVLDLGAGNGVVGEILREAGVGHLVGLDLIPEAAMAARRDRPSVYEDYVVADLTDLAPAQERRLREHDLNCLVTVAALGFGDVPAEAFVTACNLIANGGRVAMTIKDEFLDPQHRGGFGRLLRRLIDLRFLEIEARHRFRHRVSIAGEELFYVALVGRKLRALPRSSALMAKTPEVAAAAAQRAPVS